MKINQEERDFKPITIVLETKYEAIALWDCLRSINVDSGLIYSLEDLENMKGVATNISNFFSNVAQL